MIAATEIEVVPETEGTTQLSDSQLIILPLTGAEQDLLLDCERRIEDSLQSLWTIKSMNLYRSYGSFADYMERRWGMSARRGNQQVAAYSVILTLKEALADTDMPIPSTEYMVRPIASLAPEIAVQIYEEAVGLSGGGLPTNAIMLDAREIVLKEKEKKTLSALLQIEALPEDPYQPLKALANAGGDAVQILALADALEACDPFVRKRMLMAEMQDRAFIRKLDSLYHNGRDTAEEILTSGFLQFSDGTAIRLRDATVRDLQRLTNEHWKEHIAEARERNRGKAISVLVFSEDAEGTYESLAEVLDEETLLELGRLIMGKE